MKNIQEWYNSLESLGKATGIYIPPWTEITQYDIMGKDWNTGLVPQAMMDKYPEMTSIIHHFLSHQDAFSGQVAHFSKIQATTTDGYQCLHMIVSHFHPACGQARAQEHQPQLRRDQDFISFSVEMLKYFQSF